MNDKEISKETILKAEIVISSLVAILASGTVLFHILEKWSWVDAFYFICMTITTIGYGDLTPSSDATKLLTIFYAFLGISLLLLVLETMTKHYINKKYARRVDK